MENKGTLAELRGDLSAPDANNTPSKPRQSSYTAAKKQPRAAKQLRFEAQSGDFSRLCSCSLESSALCASDGYINSCRDTSAKLKSNMHTYFVCIHFCCLLHVSEIPAQSMGQSGLVKLANVVFASLSHASVG